MDSGDSFREVEIKDDLDKYKYVSEKLETPNGDNKSKEGIGEYLSEENDEVFQKDYDSEEEDILSDKYESDSKDEEENIDFMSEEVADRESDSENIKPYLELPSNSLVSFAYFSVKEYLTERAQF